MDYVIPYSWYYHPNFVDPLYSQYLLPRKIYLNPFLLNKNEFRDGCKGLYFRKKYTEYPCPPGYDCYNLDFCKKNSKNLIGLYNCPFLKEFPSNSETSIEFYQNGLQR